VDPPNSQVNKFYVDLVESMIRCDPLDTHQLKHIERNVITLRHRFSFEGLSFLTKTLPKLGKALDKGLINQRLEVPREFKRSSRNPNIPAFLQEYFSLLFDADGFLQADASALCVNHIRQICFCAYKLEVPYDEGSCQNVIDKFTSTDLGLAEPDVLRTDSFIDVIGNVTGHIFSGFDPTDICPRHGPGSVATGETLEKKWDFSRLYSCIHSVYPYYDYFIVGGASELLDRLTWYKSLTRLSEGVAKVILVPKDSRGPRLISCEPLEFQWIQQGLGRKLMQFLEKESSFTRGCINFSQQSVNQRLAVEGSITSQWSTIDLSDASDRVSLSLVKSVFSKSALLKYLLGTRSSATTLPNGEVFRLRKFAPMGSALCFPVEAYIFWVVCVVSVAQKLGVPWSIAGRSIYVYGDDIIVPTTWFDSVVAGLHDVGLVVNTEKSCAKGLFRESCGIDAFKGVIVTPHRLRTPWTGRNTDGSAYVSYISLANSLSRSYSRCSDFIWKELSRVYGRIPYALVDSSFPGRIVHSYTKALVLNRGISKKWSKDFQLFKLKVLKLRSRKIRSRLDGWTRLLRDLVSPPFDDPSVVVIPRSTSLIRGWARL
jgi:hypothetical protein